MMATVDVDAWGRSERTRRLVRRATAPFYRRWFRAEVDGLERIPPTGGALLVANHAGALPVDAALLMHGHRDAPPARPVYGASSLDAPGDAVRGNVPGPQRGCRGQPGQRPPSARRRRPAGARLPRRHQGHDEAVLAAISSCSASAAAASSTWRCAPASRCVPIAVTGTEEAMPTLFSIAHRSVRCGSRSPSTPSSSAPSEASSRCRSRSMPTSSNRSASTYRPGSRRTAVGRSPTGGGRSGRGSRTSSIGWSEPGVAIGGRLMVRRVLVTGASTPLGRGVVAG